MAYLVEFHAITKILLILREITKKITKNFQLPKNYEILPKVIKITKSGTLVPDISLPVVKFWFLSATPNEISSRMKFQAE
jgi:hypothetical protein